NMVYERIEDGKPAIWTITHPFINNLGIKKVVCVDFNPQLINENYFKATITFEEYRPRIIKKEKKTSTKTNVNTNKNSERTLTKKVSLKTIQNPCKNNGFANKKCREYYYRWRREKENKTTSLPFDKWLDETIKTEGKPISADD
ncbi:MAG: hypothetical protein GXO21_04680, partial [Aquificae bacterium]|nr:hypothetical protein [Aquificota bacterium]